MLLRTGGETGPFVAARDAELIPAGGARRVTVVPRWSQDAISPRRVLAAPGEVMRAIVVSK